MKISMPSIKIQLTLPLNVDVAKIASYFPEFLYRGPITLFNGTALTSEYIVNDRNDDKIAVLFFDDKTESGFTSIASSYSQKELAVLFLRLPATLSEPLITALNKTKLEIPKISEKEHLEIIAAQEAAQEAAKEAAKEAERIREAKLNALRKPLKGAIAVDFKPTQAVTVLQHEFAITTATSEQPILGTYAARSCIILALYNRANKTAILAHIDIMVPIVSLSKLLQQMSSNTIAHLAGGDETTKSQCMELIEFLTNNGIVIVNADLIRDSYESASFAIDARTGNIYSPVRPNQLHQTSDIKLRLERSLKQYMDTPLVQYRFIPPEPKKEEHIATAIGKKEEPKGSNPDSKSDDPKKPQAPAHWKNPSPAAQSAIAFFQDPKKEEVFKPSSNNHFKL